MSPTFTSPANVHRRSAARKSKVTPAYTRLQGSETKKTRKDRQKISSVFEQKCPDTVLPFPSAVVLVTFLFFRMRLSQLLARFFSPVTKQFRFCMLLTVFGGHHSSQVLLKEAFCVCMQGLGEPPTSPWETSKSPVLLHFVYCKTLKHFPPPSLGRLSSCPGRSEENT